MDEPTKCVLQLYINTDLKKAAKSAGINLSKEFEDWIKIRLNKVDEQNDKQDNKDVDILIAEHRAEIMKLQSQAELKAQQSEKDKEASIVIKDTVDNILQYRYDDDNKNFTWQQIIDKRKFGLMFLFKKRLNRTISDIEAEKYLKDELTSRSIEL